MRHLHALDMVQVYGSQLKAVTGSAAPLAALDCGAGIGRVSEQLLLHLFAEVDLVEPSQHLLDTARRRLSPSSKQCGPAAILLRCCALYPYCG